MDILYKFKNLTLKQICTKVLKKIINKSTNTLLKQKDLNKETRTTDKNVSINNTYLLVNSVIKHYNHLNSLRSLCNKYLSHEFDLLGSGFIKVDYKLNSIGVLDKNYSMSLNIDDFKENMDWLNKVLLPLHITYSKEILKLVGKEYEYIDWQLDFKSGYRYSAKRWYKDQPIGKDLGVDIKVPWELSRMQHLPQMAIGAVNFKDLKDKLIKEFKNQVLDFIAMNPPRMGCNWTCTMDVAIRVSNMLLAYDIFSQIDENNILGEEFKSIFTNSVYDHGKFIVNNLEWYEKIRGNHYLSDICGLLFVSAYLDGNEETDSWLVFSVQEIINEMNYQFYEDGSNFEASTSYHRLSGELMVYSTALIYGILNTDKKYALKNYNHKLIKRLLSFEKQLYNLENKEFFPKWYLERLYKAAKFTKDITKENNDIPQIGDNDSGRFFKFTPVGEFLSLRELKNKYLNLKNYNGIDGENKYWDEHILNQESFIAAVGGLFSSNEFEEYYNKYPIEYNIVKSLSKGISIDFQVEEHSKLNLYKGSIPKLDYVKVKEINFKEYNNDCIDISKLKSIYYPNFGLYLYKSKEFYLCIMAGENGQCGNGGHAHNDKLSFELNLGGKDIIVDPGTYLYTPFPKKRDKFRSIKVHNVPIIKEEEQNTFINAFSMKNETKCYVLDYSSNSVKLYLIYRDVHIVREFNILSDKLVIKDSCNYDFYQNFNYGKIYSNGYGKLVKK
ncbi:heparinase II/III family protein [Clostridium novyi]|uniref:Uncharacterized protein n=1 Tax=Clostridium novyi (strain NT) TaxID=386415 RepID=A0PZ14_CLONN|nr:heparinase II/III family protein [Clostridium novyi]ABK60682.1 hypothetical protein NT01CX_1535 [Clostridium novyi NT]KEH84805.1 hypothetical protein Z966_10210 [Clostridium novyi A str. NCTC 538]